MKLRLKLLIDALAGRPLVAVLNLLAYPLGKMLRRNHTLDPTQVVVVCKLMGLGNIVQSTPLLHALQHRFPAARIVYLTRAQNSAYCKRIDVIHETLTIDDGSALRLLRTVISVLRRLWALKADLFINLEVYSNIGALLAITSCARNRLGYFMTPRDQRAWGIYTHIVYFNRSAPISEVYLQAARCLGIEVLDIKLMKPRIDTTDVLALRDKLTGFSVPRGPYLLVNPNSSELSLERRWPPSHFAQAMTVLHRNHPDIHFLLIGGPHEEATGTAVLRHLPASIPVTDLTARLNIVDLMALLQGASAVLTNDSGPMHLAFSLNVPTVALFGPVSPDHYGGSTGPARMLLYRRLYCSPCVHHFLEAPCGGDNQCMKLISPQEVAAALEAVLSGHAISQIEAPLRYFDQALVYGGHRRKGSVDGA